MTTNYYDVLGVAKDAETAQIKTAFKKLSLIWHPDKLSSDMSRPKLTSKQEAIYESIEKASTDKSKVYENYYKELIMAHEILSDTQKRKEYDLVQSSGDASGNGPFDAKFSSFAFFQRGSRGDDYTPKQFDEREWFPLQEIECTKAEMKRYSSTDLGLYGVSRFGSNFYGGFYRHTEDARTHYMVVAFWDFDYPITKASLLKRWTEDPLYGMNIHKIKTLPRNRMFTDQGQDRPTVVIEDALEIYKLLQMLKRENIHNCKDLHQLSELEKIVTLAGQKAGIPTYQSWRETASKELIRIATLSKPKSSILSYFQSKAEALLIDRIIQDLGSNQVLKLGSSYELCSWHKTLGMYLKDLQESNKDLYQKSKVLPKLFSTLLKQEWQMMSVGKVSMLKQEHKPIFRLGQGS